MFLDPDRYWPELCRRLGCFELIDDARFATVDLRAQNGLELYEILKGAFLQRTTREWGDAFAHWDAPWEFVQSITEVAQDPQAQANGYLFEVEVSDGTKVKLVAGPVTIDGSATPANPRRAPSKGEHTLQLLREVGIEDETLERMQRGGIIS